MKKWIAMLLALTLATGLAACGATENKENVNVPASALEVLEKTWGAMAEENKFYAMGGDVNNMVENAPGAFDPKNEGITGTLLVPAEQVANVDQAASLMHGMLANNFTCGVFHVTQGADAAAFAEAMKNAISTNPWMCGMPEKMLIAVVGGEYVLAAFGINDAITPFETAFNAQYPDAEVKYSQAIAG